MYYIKYPSIKSECHTPLEYTFISIIIPQSTIYEIAFSNQIFHLFNFHMYLLRKMKRWNHENPLLTIKWKKGSSFPVWTTKTHKFLLSWHSLDWYWSSHHVIFIYFYYGRANILLLDWISSPEKWVENLGKMNFKILIVCFIKALTFFNYSFMCIVLYI